MGQPLMDGPFIGMEGDAQFLEDWFQPGLDFLYSHGPLPSFRFGEAAGIAHGKRMGEVIPAPQHGP
jgi:hypothetical protein